MTARKAAYLWRFARCQFGSPAYARPGLGVPGYASRSVPGQLAGNPRMVEAGGQHIPRLSLRAGLCLHPYCSGEHSDAERVIRPIASARS
jgi:hypothetical protein